MRCNGPPIVKSFGGTLVAAPICPPAPPPATVTSNAPTRFFQQHHQVEPPRIDDREFRPGWRVKTKLVLLFECGRVDRHQFAAAEVFKGWCEATGRQRASAWLALRDVGLALGNERMNYCTGRSSTICPGPRPASA